jgi:hypothetical protein
MADHVGLPADASPDQQVAGVGAVLQNLSPFNLEARSRMSCGFREQRIEVVVQLKRANAKRGDDGLSAHRTGLRHQCDIRVFHGAPPGQEGGGSYSLIPGVAECGSGPRSCPVTRRC